VFKKILVVELTALSSRFGRANSLFKLLCFTWWSTRFLRGGETYYINFVDNLVLFLTVKEFSRLVNIWWSYCKNSTPRFLRHSGSLYLLLKPKF